MSKRVQRLEQSGHATRVSPDAWKLLARCQQHFLSTSGITVPLSKLIEAALKSWAPGVLGDPTAKEQINAR